MAFKDDFAAGLKKASLKINQYRLCIEWAFGKIPEGKTLANDLRVIWNETHGDIFRIEWNNDIKETAKQIGCAWRKYERQKCRED